jgi:signal transduction histidine kinase
MISSKHQPAEIEVIQKKIVDYLWLVGGILGTIAFISSAIAIDEPFVIRIVQACILVILFVVYFFREKISVRTKINMVLVFIMVLVFNAIHLSGPKATLTILLVLVSVVSLMTYSKRTSILLFISFLLAYICCGILFIYVFDRFPGQSIILWVNHSILIALVGLTIQLFLSTYIVSFQNLVYTLESRNAELNENQRELFETKSLLESAIANARTGIMVADARTRRLRLANEAAFFTHGKKAELLHGIDPEEYTREWEVMHPDETPYEPTELPLFRALVQGEYVESEEAIIRVGGEDHWIIANAAPIRDSEEQIVSAIVAFHEITELKKIQLNLEELVNERTEDLKQANQELLQQKRTLEKSFSELKETQSQLIRSEKMASLGVLVAGVGHEINNPLNFLRGGLDGIKKMLVDFPEHKVNYQEITELIQVMEDGVTRTSNIVRSLSHISHQSTNNQERCDVHLILENCLVVLHNTLKKKVIVEKEWDGEELILMANEGKLHQLFMNLISNAEQAIKDKGVVNISTGRNETSIWIAIEDNGEGIPDAIISKIMDPFFTTKQPGKGTGLGLFIVHSILDELNGQIDIKSRLGEGTRVKVNFPISG